jgi:hypothetical protein
LSEAIRILPVGRLTRATGSARKPTLSSRFSSLRIFLSRDPPARAPAILWRVQTTIITKKKSNKRPKMHRHDAVFCPPGRIRNRHRLGGGDMRGM